MKRIINKIYMLTATFISVCMIGNINVKADTAEELDCNVVISNGSSSYNVSDGSYDTSVTLNSGDTVTVSLNTPAMGVYIIWGKPVEEWTLKIGDKEEKRGNNGFLHEYIEFETEINEFTIVADSGNTLTDIYCYSKGELPEDVQVWEPMCEKADILLLSTHADDEILFFGGILPYYAGEMGYEVQVVYFSEYWTGANIREHEKLDGLWHAGVTHYPYTGDFMDLYADNLEAAIQLFGEEKPVEFVVEMLRRFKPQIAVAQDENGEYGHGTHMLTSLAMKKAVEISMEETSYPESANKYGVWDVPKTYLHLYGENEIVLDCRSPLSHFGGKTTLEVAAESYKKHVSQQWCWFYVDDEYEYSCAKYGLYRTTVGVDTTNDIMENITDYKTQYEEEQKRKEEESIRESQSIAEAESLKEESRREQESIKAEEERKQNSGRTVRNVILVIAGIVVAVMILYFILLMRVVSKRKKRRKKRKNSK
ncbi:MAG: PIG-L family deacetylase [Lachnospiraceae bacterium]|nr:PIG-L family deacetylase [Lachnospiraceae bacterium]